MSKAFVCMLKTTVWVHIDLRTSYIHLSLPLEEKKQLLDTEIYYVYKFELNLSNGLGVAYTRMSIDENNYY